MAEINVEFRKPRYARADEQAIDMEINHPAFGWIPFTATSNAPEEYNRALFAAAIDAGNVGPYRPLTDEENRAAMPNVSARQLRLTLIRNGLSLSSIDSAIAALPEGPQKDEATVEWEYAHEFQRVSPTLNSIATALGLSQDQVDAMWSQAIAA